jgi:hypothetical protein
MWKNHNKCRQTKLWFAEPDRNLSRDIIQRSKANLGQLVQFFTGHNNLMRHQFIINNDAMWIQPAGSVCKKHHGMSLLSVQHISKKGGKFSTNRSFLIL